MKRWLIVFSSLVLLLCAARAEGVYYHDADDPLAKAK